MTEHKDYQGNPDLRSLQERALASDAIPSDADDAIAIVVERLRLMHKKMQNAPLHPDLHGRHALPATDGPIVPTDWTPYRTLVAWSPILWDYAQLVEKRLVCMEKALVERDEALKEAREAAFGASDAERAFNRRAAVLGPRLRTVLQDALAVLAEPLPDQSKAPGAKDWLEGIAAEIEQCAGGGPGVIGDVPGPIREKLLALAARVRA